MNFQSVCVIGLGYIGLPTAAIIAGNNIAVTGVDTNQQTVDIINRGNIHIVEVDLDQLVSKVVSNGSLKAVIAPTPADVFIIAVPTPFGPGQAPDMSYVDAACKSIAPVLSKGNLVILESTSPVGSTENLSRQLAGLRPDLVIAGPDGGDADVMIAYCPERVLPGKILQELVENDRVIGGITSASSEAARAFYSIFVNGQCILTDARTAEMCKLTENSFRDVNIAFANELSILCDKFRIDVWELIRLANRHPRVSILQPGVGVGGHCIAVDPWFIVHSAPEEARMIRLAREINDGKVKWSYSKLKEQLETLSMQLNRKPVVACLGLAFKPDIDDLRESPALRFCRTIVSKGDCEVLAVEPHIERLPEDMLNVRLVDLDEAVDQADIILTLVRHRIFIDKLPSAPLERAVIDFCGLWAQ